MHKVVSQILNNYFPKNLRTSIKNYIDTLPKLHDLEEIRLRLGRPVMLVFADRDKTIDYLVEISDVQNVLSLISENSVYSYQNELNNGFITVTGGHRVGVVGKTHIKDGEIKTIKDISSINFRIAKEVIGVGSKIINHLVDKRTNTLCNTILVGPPASGKTTVLRDLARIISSGENNVVPHQVTLIDERSELSGVVKGIPQKDIGLRTDVLSGCPKHQGIILALRSMSPEVIITDEIGFEHEISAINEAINSGVKVLLTAHGDDLTTLSNRSGIDKLFQSQILDRILCLSRRRGPATIESIHKKSSERLQKINLS